MKKENTDKQTRDRGSSVCSFKRAKTAKKMKITARCWVIEHDNTTRGQYVYGLKFAENCFLDESSEEAQNYTTYDSFARMQGISPGEHNYPGMLVFSIAPFPNCRPCQVGDVLSYGCQQAVAATGQPTRLLCF